jgi:methionine sulfoxide reductase heme-binding subunit
MAFLKKNYGWMIVAILATLPLIPLFSMGQEGGKVNIDMLYHISGEFAIRWMTAVLTLTPVFIVFGVYNLFVRQAMGIATAVWSFIHFILFIWAEGFIETFTQVNYVSGFVAILILIPLFFTSNQKSMKWLKSKWKKIQSFSYLAIFLSLLHIVLLEKTWLIYTIVVGVGFIIRVPAVKNKILGFRNNRKKAKYNDEYL